MDWHGNAEPVLNKVLDIDKNVCRKLQGRAEEFNTCFENPGTCESCPDWWMGTIKKRSLGIMATSDDIKRSAVFSQDRMYRYMLLREWHQIPAETEPGYPTPRQTAVAFIGLNPSTADESRDDNTIKRCIDFAKRWGYGRLLMLNLFSYRATKPLDMLAAYNHGRRIIGSSEDEYLGSKEHLLCFIKGYKCDSVIAAWGTHAKKPLAELIKVRGDEVTRYLTKCGIRLQCLDVTKDHNPKHPLYIPANMPLHPWGIYG